MKIAILADVHSNYYALEAILKHSQRREAERYWVLGDIVGYGPHPERCLEWLKQEYQRVDWVLGNHDAMLRGVFIKKQSSMPNKDSMTLYRENQFALVELVEAEAASRKPDQTASVNEAVMAVRHNLETLEKHPDLDGFWKMVFAREHMGPKKISSIPGAGCVNALGRVFDRRKEKEIEYWIVHASYKEPLGKYIYPWTSYYLKKELQDLIDVAKPSGKAICEWHGHGHIPYLLTLDEMQVNGGWSPICVSIGKPYPLGKAVTIANPGSVGQPRNGDTRACYAILDTAQRTVVFHRVDYEWSKTAGDMQRGGYDKLIRRLKTAAYPTDEPPNEMWIRYMELQKKENSIP